MEYAKRVLKNIDWPLLSILGSIVLSSVGAVSYLKHDINTAITWIKHDIDRLDDRHRTDMKTAEKRWAKMDERWQWMFERMDKKIDNIKKGN